MGRGTSVNWIKLGNVSSAETATLPFVEHWIEHNADLQILKKYSIEKTTTLLPPNRKAETVVAYIVKWRKALQQYKGNWQWRDVETHMFVEVGKINPQQPKPVVKPTISSEVEQPKAIEVPAEVAVAQVDKVVEEPKIQKPVVTEQPKEREIKVPEQKVAKENQPKPVKPVAHFDKQRQPHNGTGLEQSIKRAVDPKKRVNHKADSNNSQNTVNRQAHSYEEKHEMVILHGLETKYQKVYGRRKLK